MSRRDRVPTSLLVLTLFILAGSLVFAHDKLNWVLETFPVLLGLPALLFTYRRQRLTTFMYSWLVFHSLILCVGAIYTYAKVPLGFWMMDWFGFSRNHYDRIGHFFQGFIPALLVREVLLYASPLKPGKWLTFIVISIALAISAFYELIEFGYTVAIGASAEAFLGTQGDVWDAQWDMTFALTGAIIALLLFSRLQTRLVKKTEHEKFRAPMLKLLFLLAPMIVVPPQRVVGRKAHYNKLPKGFVALTRVVPRVRLEIKYHTAHNFTGAPLPGYGVPSAWLRVRAAKALARVSRDLHKLGYGLLVFDAYRPRRATLAMVAWAMRSGQQWQVEKGYIARTSKHNRGAAVDLSLYALKTGREVPMGTTFDSMDPKSHTMAVKGVFLKRRLILKNAMERHGFKNFSKEWWHFNYTPLKSAPPRDTPYACFEHPEGKWKPPKDWARPTYKPKTAWNPDFCK